MGYIYNTFPEDKPPVIILTPAENTYTVPAGNFIETIVLNPTNGDTINAGYTPGGSEIAEAFELEQFDNNSVVVQRKFDEDTIIYFDGITEDVTATIYQR